MRFHYLGSVNNLGVSSLLNQNATFDSSLSDLLPTINSLFPEREKMHHHHPEWLVDNTIDVLSPTEITVRFVDEGAGYRNGVGYFIFDTNNPPPSINHIGECYFIFPNCSKINSGGGLKTGDSIKLGSKFSFITQNGLSIANPTETVFDEGKSVGFILYPNGWRGSEVSRYIVPYTSLNRHNPEGAEELRFHTACLKVPDTERLVIGFEDLRRDSSGCDHDFNDAIFVIDTDLKSIGPGFTDTKSFAPSDDDPLLPSEYTIGYKKILATHKGFLVEAVATLFIPKDTKVFHNYEIKGNRLRCEKAYVRSIFISPKTTLATTRKYVGHSLEEGFSWYDRSFSYKPKTLVESTMSEDGTDGIHYFASRDLAKRYNFDPYDTSFF